MGLRIGIDLGTTNSVVAIWDIDRARIIDNKEGQPLTPSVVSLRMRENKPIPNAILVGQSALNNMELAPEDTIFSIKRLMGRAWTDENVQKLRKKVPYKIVEPSRGTEDSVNVVMGGREYSPVEISAEILKKLKCDTEFQLHEEVTHCVVTVPAYFSQAQRRATREACMMAGMKVLKVASEPEAAAIASGFLTDKEKDSKFLMVYDLGGGTFDVSLGIISANLFSPLNTGGDMWLGGDNFDEAIENILWKEINQNHKFESKYKNTISATVKINARAAKERLSSDETTDVNVTARKAMDINNNTIGVDIEISRNMVNREYMKLVQDSLQEVQRTIEGLQLEVSQIDYVFFAGNATRMPVVRDAVEKLFGEERILPVYEPKLAVAKGAAFMALKSNYITCQAPDEDNPEIECGEENDLNAVRCKKCKAPLVYEKICRAPDKDNPNKICGTPNEPTALNCRKCGEPLEPPPPPPPPPPISPFWYGIQLSGDEFDVFIEKNEPYPTAQPKIKRRHTTRPNQREVVLPVYACDDRNKFNRASQNHKEGQAIAFLPSSQPQGTGVKISFWLDSDGIFDLDASLDNGKPLNPLVLKGNEGARTLKILDQIRDKLVKVVSDVSSQDLQKLDLKIDEIYSLLQNGRFEEALKKAEELLIINGNGNGDPDELKKWAKNLLMILNDILNEYEWALKLENDNDFRLRDFGLSFREMERIRIVAEGWIDSVEQLNNFLVFGWGFDPEKWTEYKKLRDEIQRALISNAPNLKDLVEQGKKSLDDLPLIVKTERLFRRIIKAKIAPTEEKLADELRRKSDGFLNKLRSGRLPEPREFFDLAECIFEAYKFVILKRGIVCGCGEKIPPDTSICPKCGCSINLLAGSKSMTDPGISLSRPLAGLDSFEVAKT